MNKFVIFIVKALIILILTMGLLDVSYTFVYKQNNDRNKISYLYNSKDKNYDVVFLGSSRVNNHLNPKIFNEQGYRTFNFGITRSRLDESALMLNVYSSTIEPVVETLLSMVFASAVAVR